MAFDFHNDREKYFEIQRLGAEQSIIPYLKHFAGLKKSTRVLEIGSHLGGNLRPFLKEGCHCIGVEIDKSHADQSKINFAKEIAEGTVTIIHSDIYDVTVGDLGGPVDLIFLKDSIEHIPDPERIIAHVSRYCSRESSVFFAFPPWQMPFGGHQQGAKSFFLSHCPWIHLLPKNVYSLCIKKLGESEAFHEFLMSCVATGITIERFEKAVKASPLKVVHKESYLVAPIYKFKFGLPVIKLPVFFGGIPFVRNFYTTSIYYLLQLR